MQNSKKAIIVVLLLAIAGLGYAVYSRQAAPEAPTAQVQNENPTPAGNVDATGVKEQAASASKVSLAEVRKILSDRGASPTKEALDRFSTSVTAAAVRSSVLDISGCVATPNVIEVFAGEPFTVKNTDNFPHVIHYGGKNPETIPGSTERKITLEFPNAEKGVAGVMSPFTCDTDKTEEPIGIFSVVPRSDE
ncbi:MAG: hypothetical protein HZA81_03480 [Candidatus Taylorbacteria bacterium]|nr:hypothetical protein [Candidatus Taylorbacteria bacterium]